MDEQEKKYEVKLKVSTGTQIGVAIAILAIVAAGAGLAGFFMTRDTTTTNTAVTKSAETPAAPGAFNLLTPASKATEVDYTQAFDWSDSSGATSYDVYVAVAGTFGTPTANVTTSQYKHTILKPGRDYSWKVVAKNNSGTKTSSTWTFGTAGGSKWIQALGYTPVDETISSACGANRECDTNNELTCPEYDAVWLACNGISNKCPENLAEQCEQMTICQCSGVSPGGPECTTYLETWVNPCEQVENFFER